MSVMLEQTPVLRQSVTPQLIEASQILAMSAAELEQAIAREIARNPALELGDTATCPRCGSVMERSICAACRFDQQMDDKRLRAEWNAVDRELDREARGAITAEDFDPMTLVASDVSPIERLLADVATIVNADERAVAEYLLHSLDERGYLVVSLAEVADRFGQSIDQVERVLATIQQIAPPGVGARSVRECLLLQLDYLSHQPSTPAPAEARRIVEEHLEDIAAHRYSRIARRLGLTTADVTRVHDYLRTALTPSPLQMPDARTWRTPNRAPLVVPDIIVYLVDGELRVKIVESRASRLRLDPLYAELVADLRHNDQLGSQADRAHVRQHVSRARLFLLAVNQRHETLRRITACLLELQRDFVLHGVRALRPLTRGQVAEAVGLHESTVSRATAAKYIMLPNREVIPISTFFVASLSTKDIIRELIQRENRAMTDEEIGQRLHAQGIRIARRTVAKYRSTLGILPSTFRHGQAAAATA